MFRKNQFILIILVIFLSSIHVNGVRAAATPPSGGVVVDATTQDWIALFAYILLALLFSFLCSVAEAVLLNITPSFIADLREKDEEFAVIVQRVRQADIDQSLAAILTMNTIAHTVGSIGSGAKATIVFGSAWFGVFSGIMTFLILIFSEIIPKTIGVVYWRKLVKSVVNYIRTLNFILAPIIYVSEYITKLIAKDKSDQVFSRDEFVAMATVGQEEGHLNTREFMIIQNLFRLVSLTPEDIYTPRTVITAFHEDSTVAEVVQNKQMLGFSRIIIHQGSLDKVTGFVLTDELLLLNGDGHGDTILKELKRDIMAVPIKYTLSKLLEDFLEKKEQIAIVVDEFGTKGLVTIEDILETLLGMEIVDENDSIDDMRILAKQIWKNRMESLGIDIDHLPPDLQNEYEDFIDERETETT